MAWELKGKYPRIFDDPTVGTEAAQAVRRRPATAGRIVAERLLRARGGVRLLAGRAVGDDIVLFADETRPARTGPVSTPCGSNGNARGRRRFTPWPTSSPRSTAAGADYLGAFAVTAGIGVDELVADFEREHDDYNAILVKALADRLAEAFAEALHKQVREEWGYGREREPVATTI